MIKNSKQKLLDELVKISMAWYGCTKKLNEISENEQNKALQVEYEKLAKALKEIISLYEDSG